MIISEISTQSSALSSITSSLRSICSMNFRSSARCSNHQCWSHSFWHWVSQSRYFNATRMCVNLSASIASECNNITIRNTAEDTALQISSTERWFMCRHFLSVTTSDNILLYEFSAAMMMRMIIRISQLESVLLWKMQMTW